jgi:hypothetical protein
MTEGGLALNTNHQVLKADGTAIQGLHAAGTTGQGGAVVSGHGNHVGWAMTSGRRAGRFAAERTLTQVQVRIDSVAAYGSAVLMVQQSIGSTGVYRWEALLSISTFSQACTARILSFSAGHVNGSCQRLLRSLLNRVDLQPPAVTQWAATFATRNITIN